MIYVFEYEGNSVGVVYDETVLSTEQKEKGIAIEYLPERPVEIDGKRIVLKASKARNEVWYEYEDIPKDENLETLKKQLELQQSLLDDLLLNVIPILMSGGEI